MISRVEGKGFFVAHYEWVVLGIGVVVLALGIVLFMTSSGEDPELAASDRVRALESRHTDAKKGVAMTDMTDYKAALVTVFHPTMLQDVTDEKESAFASERRVICSCGMVLPGDGKDYPKCPKCGRVREDAKKIVVDADGDGMPDVWEKKYGLNLNDPSDAAADADNDDFTNLEEFEAKTDPTDRNSHPDYLQSLRLQLPLQQTHLPFVLLGANKIPAGWRCEFFNAKQRDDYGRPGKVLSAVIGEEIGTSGFTLKDYAPKFIKRTIKGSENLKEVDVSEATVVRKSDGKTITLVRAENQKKAKPQAIETKATLVYERKGTQNFVVIEGDVITLSGTKYKVEGISVTGKKSTVVLSEVLKGTKHTIETLEP